MRVRVRRHEKIKRRKMKKKRWDYEGLEVM